MHSIELLTIKVPIIKKRPGNLVLLDPNSNPLIPISISIISIHYNELKKNSINFNTFPEVSVISIIAEDHQRSSKIAKD